MNRYLGIFAIAGLLLLPRVTAVAAPTGVVTVEFLDGSTVKGDFFGLDDTSITILGADGHGQEIHLAKVARVTDAHGSIVYGTAAEVPSQPTPVATAQPTVIPTEAATPNPPTDTKPSKADIQKRKINATRKPVKTEDQSASDGDQSWWPALVPGWQQFRCGDKLSGTLFAAGFVASVGATIYFNMAGDQSYSSYKAASNSTDAQNLYNQTTSQDQLYTTFGWVTVSVYVLNVADGLLFENTVEGSGNTAKINPLVPQMAVAVSPKGTEQLVLGWRL